MPEDISNRLIIGISSRALFDLEESNTLFEEEGLERYATYQIEHENDVLAPGPAFHLVKKLLDINQFGEYVEVILMSRNSADTGLRIFNSIHHYGLDITRAAFTNGSSRDPYIKAYGVQLFLSTRPEDVVRALSQGNAAATIYTGNPTPSEHSELRIAFDGDAVVFSDEAEQVFQREGIEAFHQSEANQAQKPLSNGPFQGFLKSLHDIQKDFPVGQCPIRTALVTAREAPAHERVIRTLRTWDIRIDEALFLGGLTKGEFLNAFGADIFFDDQEGHCDNARHLVTTGHVPNGVKNTPSATQNKEST